MSTFSIFIVKILTMFCSRRLNLWIKRKYDIAYSIWLKKYIGELGENSIISYPATLEGGRYKHIYIGSNTRINANSILGCWGNYGDDKFNATIRIGDDCSIGEYFHISAIKMIKIGNGLLTGRYVYIGDNSHGGLSKEEAGLPPAKRKLLSRGGVEIGNNVWIGDKSTILSGVTIGDNVIIGANSVVTHDIPSNSMAAGSPAKVIKQI